MACGILHVDMDEFFAAVEKLDNPDLIGKCLLIGGDASARGVVSTASYEARAFGCHSAQPMATAVRLCPHALVLPVRGSRYAEVSEQIFEVFRRFTPLVEPLSIDEAFLDVAGSARLFGPAEEIARQIKHAIRHDVGLTASVGVAPNKFLAKLASDLEKPDGLTVIAEDRIHDVLDPLPVTKLWGVGPACEGQLQRLGIRTIAQLRRYDPQTLRGRLGEAGEHLHRLAWGLDARPVTPDHRAKSISQECTFAVDVADLDELRRVLLGQAEQVARRLRRHELLGRTVTLKIRYGDFTTRTRSATLRRATNVTETLWRQAAGLLAEWARAEPGPLRLLGLGVSQLSRQAGAQLELFPDADQVKHRRLDQALDGIVDRFGSAAIRRGAADPPRPRPPESHRPGPAADDLDP